LIPADSPELEEFEPVPEVEENTLRLASRLNVFGICLLLAYLLLVAAASLPLQILNPSWQLGLSTALVDNAAIALVGVALLQIAAFLDPEDERLQQRVAWVARLAILASLGFLLLIPLRAYNLFTVSDVAGNVQERRLSQASTRLNQLRDAVRGAASKEELGSRLKALNAPALPPAIEAKPLEAIRADMNRSFERMEAALQQRRQQSRQPRPGTRTNLVVANLRQMLTALVFAVAFAAAGQRFSSPFTFLDDLLSRLGRGGRLPESGEQAAGPTDMGNYYNQISPQQDPPNSAPPPG